MPGIIPLCGEIGTTEGKAYRQHAAVSLPEEGVQT
jgi:hypothetical protein